MGNAINSEYQDWRHQLSPTKVDPQYDYLSHWQNSKGDTFLAREIELPQHLGLQTLKKRIQNRQKNLNHTNCIYPLSQCYFQHSSSLCSQQQRCLLTSLKPKNNLEKIFLGRKSQNISFSSQEIGLIIDKISQAFKIILEWGQSFCPLRLSHIVFTDKIYLLDPILIENDPFGYGILGQFPAPEQLKQQTQLTLTKQSKLAVQLFSLGIVALQLFHSHKNIKDIYIRYNKYGSITNLNTNLLNELILNISDPHLRNKIGILVSFNPQNRKKIFEITQKDNWNPHKIQNILAQLLLQNHNIKSNPISPFTKNQAKYSILKQLPHPNRNTIHHPQPKLAPPEEKKSIIPKVSINFVSKIHNNQIVQNGPSTFNSKKLITFSHLNHQPKPHGYKTKNNQNIQNHTPMRMKKKHNFSTIKQVSEDQCGSTSRLKTFEDISIDGKYEGEMKEGKRQGKGVFYFQQGSVYDGQWFNDQMHGFGRLYYPSGKIAYQGLWRNNQFSGNGKVYNNSPKQITGNFDFTDFNQLGEEWVSYEGSLYQDQRHGSGCLILSNGEWLQGNFAQDKVHGICKFTTLQGKIIRGIWNESVLQRTFNE